MKKLSFIALWLGVIVLVTSCGSSKTVKGTTTAQKSSSVRQTDVQTLKYIAKYKKAAQQKMRDYGIPASITLAQGILESASGTSYLARVANNHFGIKCADNWEGPKVYKDDDHKNECFRRYKDAAESFRDHSEFLAKRRRYAFLFRLPPGDYEAWAKGLKKAGYATDPSYPSKLIYIIEKYKLHELDKEVLKGMKIKEESIVYENNNNQSEKIIYEVKPGETLYTIAKKFNIPVKEIKEMNNLVDFDIYEGQILVLKMPKNKVAEVEQQVTISEEKPVEKAQEDEKAEVEENTEIQEISVEETAKEEKSDIRDKIKKETALENKGQQTLENNENMIEHIVQPKETLFSISRTYGVSVEEIKKSNGLTDNQLKVGQKLYIPVKKKEAEIQEVESQNTNLPEFHIVQPGETLYRIHVKHNVPIEKLKELNGLKDNTIRVGQKIRLR